MSYLSFPSSGKNIGLTQGDLMPKFDSQLLVCKLKSQLHFEPEGGSKELFKKTPPKKPKNSKKPQKPNPKILQRPLDWKGEVVDPNYEGEGE